MQSHDVGLSEQVIQRNRFATGVSHSVSRNEDVMHEPPALERSQSRGHFTTDASEADDPHGLIAQSSQLIKRRRQPPFSFANMQRIGNHLSCGAQYECERMIGDFVDAVIGDVAYRNAALARRLHIDVVVADAVADDDLRPLHAGDHVGIDRCKLSDDCIGIGHQRRQLRCGLPLFQRDDFMAQRPKNTLFDIQTRKRVVGDGDFHMGISLENSTQTRLYVLDIVRLSDKLIIRFAIVNRPLSTSVRKLCRKPSNDPSFATSLPIA